ncbi:MAG TPA: hypothetical protein VF923_04525 [Gemmatimonadales bacterium]
MFRKILPLVMSLALPGLLAAQREIPNSHASDTAKAKVAEHRATQVRGSVENADVTPATRAVPATRATPATPASGGNPATPAKPATPATPAVPASPSKKPTSAGQSGNHRP